MKKMCFRHRWEGRCDGGCPCWICGEEQQYYSSWFIKRTKTLKRFIEADFIITMMSWSYIFMSHLFSCKITACKATSRWRQNIPSATNAFKLVYMQFLLSTLLDSAFFNTLHQYKCFVICYRCHGIWPANSVTPYNSRIGCFEGCFPHSQTQLYNSPLQICIAGRMHFSKKNKTKKLKTTGSFQIGKKPDEEKIYHWTELFTSWTIRSEKCTRAHVQENKSIYLSLVYTHSVILVI